MKYQQNRTAQKNRGSLEKGIGIGLLSACVPADEEIGIMELAKPFLDQLRLDLHQTVVLEIPSGDHTIVTYVTEGLGPVKIRATVGDWHNYHTSAGLKRNFLGKNCKPTLIKYPFC